MSDNPIIEPAIVTGVFVTGVLPIQEPYPGIATVVFVTDEVGVEFGQKERRVAARMVIPREVLREFAIAILKASPADRLNYETADTIAAACGSAKPQ